jgi:hypothetical protein
MNGWIKKGEATSDRSKTPARRPLFGPNMFSQVKREKWNKAEKDRILRVTDQKVDIHI